MQDNGLIPSITFYSVWAASRWLTIGYERGMEEGLRTYLGWGNHGADCTKILARAFYTDNDNSDRSGTVVAELVGMVGCVRPDLIDIPQ